MVAFPETARQAGERGFVRLSHHGCFVRLSPGEGAFVRLSHHGSFVRLNPGEKVFVSVGLA